MEREIYIHIGYPKTGTTTLQRYLFPKHTDICYLNKYIHETEVIRDIFVSRENAYFRNLNSYSKVFNSIKSHLNAKNLYSNESFTSYSMFFRFQPSPYIWTMDPNSIARKICFLFKSTDYFDETKIIVTIRKPEDIIKSMYAQAYNLSYGKFRKTNTFKKFLNYSFYENANGFILDALHYYYVIKIYENLFGKSNIKVLVYEELKEEPKIFFKRIAEFMSIDKVEAYNLVKNKKSNVKSMEGNTYKTDERSIATKLRYIKNRYLGNISLGLSNTHILDILEKVRFPAKEINLSLDQKFSDLIKQEFYDDLRKLEKEYNLPLTRYGYFK